MDEIEKVSYAEIIDPQAQMVVAFLKGMGLPSDNIIAEQSERAIIGQNLPTYIQSLPDEIKRDARYLSKFVVGAGFGLFDYSLISKIEQNGRCVLNSEFKKLSANYVK
ncbi:MULTISPECIES: hypothetical protein [Aerosakkonema]|uniref:hypothetical protein n=1 Tax=Aerosakkonema TaxID=1246629 RepID=UPI0035BA27A9